MERNPRRGEDLKTLLQDYSHDDQNEQRKQPTVLTSPKTNGTESSPIKEVREIPFFRNEYSSSASEEILSGSS